MASCLCILEKNLQRFSGVAWRLFRPAFLRLGNVARSWAIFLLHSNQSPAETAAVLHNDVNNINADCLFHII